MRTNLLTVFWITLASCGSNETKYSKQIDSSNTELSTSFTRATDIKYDYYVPIRNLKQPKSMDCWATALTILYSWKYEDNTIKIEDVLKKYGSKYEILFKTNAGIQDRDEKELYKTVGLTVRQRENPTIELWYDLLKKHGPLSITVDAEPPSGTIHALVVNGIKGNGTATGTTIDYVDPGNGKQHTLVFSEFLKLYEGATVWPLQIIYWP